MVRTTIIPDKRNINISISLPDSYIGEEVEVIAFSKEEGLEIAAFPQKKKVRFDALSIDTIGFKFNRAEANER